jgi:hypothetical protein
MENNGSRKLFHSLMKMEKAHRKSEDKSKYLPNGFLLEMLSQNMMLKELRKMLLLELR